MKIDLSKIDKENFKVKEGNLFGNKVFLITPSELKCDWTKDNLHFRSMIVDDSGNILSRGFDKFFNISEKPELYPNPENFKDLIFEEKTDGSLMICDLIFDNFNARTRGTFSYKTLENAADFDFVFKKYPKIVDTVSQNSDFSYLFEITTPNQRIVLGYGNEPDIFFLGFINKRTGLYYPPYSKEGEFVQSKIGCKSPEIYPLNGSISEIVEQVKNWEKKEGVVIKYNRNQNFVKAKSLWYLARHAIKGKLASLKNILDLYFELDCPTYRAFHKNIEETIDFETAEELKEKIWKVSFAFLMAKVSEEKIAFDVDRLKDLSQKDFALKNLSTNKEYASFYFEIRAKGGLTKKSIRKLMEMDLEKKNV